MAVTGVNEYTSTYAATNSGSTRGSNGLSETAQNYLNGLKQKYSDVNITVADFSSDKQMEKYMFGSSGNNNLAISANIVEKMASDPATAAKYEKVIAGVTASGERTQKFADAHNQVIYGQGVIIDKNGKVSYWVIGGMKEAIENPGTVYKEKVQKQLEEKRAKKKEEEELEEKRLERAETEEELLKKIKANAQDAKVDENASSTKISEEGKGTQFDLSI